MEPSIPSEKRCGLEDLGVEPGSGRIGISLAELRCKLTHLILATNAGPAMPNEMRRPRDSCPHGVRYRWHPRVFL